MATDPDELVAWIADLRTRVARGELDGQGEFEVGGGGRLAIGLAARILLADLDHDKDLTPAQRRDRVAVERRRSVRADLRRLRQQIG